MVLSALIYTENYLHDTIPPFILVQINANNSIQVIIIMFLKGWVCFLFLDPQDEVGPSISSSVVPCSFVLLVYIVVLVLVVCLCPSSVRVLATFSGTVLFPLLCSVLPFFA